MKPASYCDYVNAAYDFYGYSLKKNRPEQNYAKKNSGNECTKVFCVMPETGNQCINLLTPNVNYSGRTEPLTSKVAFYIFIQQI